MTSLRHHRSALALATFLVLGLCSVAHADPPPRPAAAYTLAQRAVSGVLHRPLYWTMRALGVRVEGRENVPRTGGVILAPTHPSVLDPVLVGLGTPRLRPHFMAKIELFRGRVFGGLLRFFNAYPVDRSNPSMETRAHTERLLSAGEQVIIFPEGGVRTGDESVLGHGELKKGVGHFAANTGAVVVPVLVLGTDQIESKVSGWLERRRTDARWTRPRVVYGKPLTPPADLGPDPRAEWVTTHLRLALRELGEAHGVPRSEAPESRPAAPM